MRGPFGLAFVLGALALVWCGLFAIVAPPATAQEVAPEDRARLEEMFEKITRDLLHEISDQSTTDAMATFADRLPIFVISEMLGMPAADRVASCRVNSLNRKAQSTPAVFVENRPFCHARTNSDG